MWVRGYLSLYVCVCLCLSLCSRVWSCVSLSSLGVALCGCVHKLVCEPMLCGLAVEPWGCVAGVVIAYLHSKYFKYSLCWVHARQRLHIQTLVMISYSRYSVYKQDVSTAVSTREQIDFGPLSVATLSVDNDHPQ